MNENERGITPPGETAMTLEPFASGWLVTIEQGNGDVIQTIELTDWERMQLAGMLDMPPGSGGGALHVQFMDYSRPPLAASS